MGSERADRIVRFHIRVGSKAEREETTAERLPPIRGETGGTPSLVGRDTETGARRWEAFDVPLLSEVAGPEKNTR